MPPKAAPRICESPGCDEVVLRRRLKKCDLCHPRRCLSASTGAIDRPFAFDDLRPHLPEEAFDDADGQTVEGWLAKRLVDRFDVGRRGARTRVYVARQRGVVDIWTADLFANALGRHPSEIWPAWFDVILKIDEVPA